MMIHCSNDDVMLCGGEKEETSSSVSCNSIKRLLNRTSSIKR